MAQTSDDGHNLPYTLGSAIQTSSLIHNTSGANLSVMPPGTEHSAMQNSANSMDSLSGGAKPPFVITAAPSADNAMLRAVMATALEFLTPRTLEYHSAREFTLWGLGALTALDPTLSLHTDKKEISLMDGQKTLFTQPAPPAADSAAWVELAVHFITAAQTHSETFRKISQDDLLQTFFDELFNHLDPYSRYIGPSPASSDRIARTGGEADAGVTLTHKGGHILIKTVNANGPAWTASVDAGDRLVAVDGRSTAGQSVKTVSEWLKGSEDSLVHLRLLSPGRKRSHVVSVRRARVPPETVFAFTSGSLLILRITAFSSDTAEEMSQYLDQAMQDTHLRGIIIDLRGNRGGVLQQAVTASALLLDHGVAAVTDGRDPEANHIWAVQGGDMTSGLPIAVLVDGHTASAAEILAAALADHHRAVIIGSSTLGKGLVQTVAQLPNKSELFVTWSRVMAPLDWPLQGLGVMPHICTSLGASAIARQMHALSQGHLENKPALEASRSARFPISTSNILSIRKACPAALGRDEDTETAQMILNNKAWYKAAISATPEDASQQATATHQ